MSFPVKAFNWQMRGASPSNGTPSSWINILKACLMDGFGDATAVTGTILNGVCRLEFNASTTFQQNSVVLVSGANVVSINGENKVTSSSSNSIEFKTLESNQTLIGTITVKYAPVGSWYMPFTGTNTAALRTTSALGGDVFFHIFDTQARSMRMRMYSHMGDVNNGQKPVPILSENPFYFTKSIYSDTTAWPWFIVADERAVYFINAYYANATNPDFYRQQAWYTTGFGYLVPNGYTSKLHAFVHAPRDETLSNRSAVSFGKVMFSSDYDERDSCIVYVNPATGNYGAKTQVFSKITGGIARLLSGCTGPEFNLPNRQRILSEFMVRAEEHYIGRLPGLWCLLNKESAPVTKMEALYQGVEQLHGRSLMGVVCGDGSTYPNQAYPENSYQIGFGFIDLTGPW